MIKTTQIQDSYIARMGMLSVIKVMGSGVGATTAERTRIAVYA
jgi:hypothetical protein